MLNNTTRSIAALTLIIATASAQYALDSTTQDAGGGTLTGATYALSGTVAQPDAGPTLQGATYAIRGGFWTATMTQPPANACAADFDNDGDVDLGDFGAFGGAFGSVLGDINYNPSADFDNDNDVDLGDFGAFGGEFGRSDCLG
jgi:hypothetical protein